MRCKLVGIIAISLVSVALSAQSKSASGRLQVTAVIASSSQYIQYPDGSYRLVIANSPGRAEMLGMQLMVNRPSSGSAVLFSQDTVTVTLVPPDRLPKSKTQRR